MAHFFLFLALSLCLAVAEAINNCGWSTSPDIDACCRAHFPYIAQADTSRERILAAEDFCKCLKKTIVANAEIKARIKTNLLCDIRTLERRTEGRLPTPFLKSVSKMFRTKKGHDEEDYLYD